MILLHFAKDGIIMKRSEDTFMNFDKYTRTDLAAEMRARAGLSRPDIRGLDYREESAGEVVTSTLTVKGKEASDAISKPEGKYVTIGFPKPTVMTDEQQSILRNKISGNLKELIYSSSPYCQKAMVVGLGNCKMTADALGPECISAITVTGHVKESMPSLFSELGALATYAFSPGVKGSTGIETADLVKSAANIILPDVVIAIDALAARSPERLACTVQICDTGISPGSGVNNRRRAIDYRLLGVPVIALGVPTVTECGSMIAEMLENVPFDLQSKEIRKEIENFMSENRSLAVSPKDIDLSLKILTPIIASAIDDALTID